MFAMPLLRHRYAMPHCHLRHFSLIVIVAIFAMPYAHAATLCCFIAAPFSPCDAVDAY
jgi:hypothetical protein